MATTYVPDFTFPRDRVRFAVNDKVAPFTFQDEEIAYQLTDNGYVGDPTVAGPKQARAELLAEIALIVSLPAPSSSGDSVTIKQGSVTRTNASGVKDRTAILANLRRQLADLDGLASGDYGGPVVVDGYANWPCETTVSL